ncbi:MAG: tetratricopeptide repeat protein [Bacteroidia bacterium]|nr:tetratricopeptide repeat protein [Bacteroidia bacterium]
MNNPREARLLQLKSLLEVTPDDAFLRYAMALELFNMGQYEQSEQQFLALIHDSPEYVATYYHLAKLYEAKSEFEKAKEIYKQGIEITQKIRDMHALSELRSALNELEFDE